MSNLAHVNMVVRLVSVHKIIYQREKTRVLKILTILLNEMSDGMSYENKILQMKKMLGKKKNSMHEKPYIKNLKNQPILPDWEKAGLTYVENDFGVVFKRQVTISIYLSAWIVSTSTTF